jgi:signal peptidase I
MFGGITPMPTSEPLTTPDAQRPVKKARLRVLIRVAVVAGAILASLRLLGLIHPFSVHAGSMTPTISRGDHFIMEAFTFLVRRPQRGDIIVLKTDGIPSLPAGGIYIKRIAGQPGERLRISDGNFYANDAHVRIENEAGQIHYVSVPGARHLISSEDTVTVPDSHYFVLGDNSADSADSRIWGFLPRQNIMGRASFCYWPPARAGGVR